MKFINDYKEFGGNNEKSVIDYKLNNEPPYKETVLKYLKSGKDDGIRCSSLFDYFKNELTPEAVYHYTDGEYYWDSEEIYHFEKYNIKLNPAFIEHVLSKQ